VRASTAAWTVMSAARAREERTPRASVVGMSVSSTCGVRDHAALLATTMGQPPSSVHWLRRANASARAARSEVRTWTRELPGVIASDDPDAVLLHYSVFAYSYRGVPLYIGPTLAAMRASGRPLVAVLHEFAHPWAGAGLRGTVWAASHRAVLVELLRRSTAVVVTTDARAAWLASRSWLPRRRVAVAPVFSNLPAPVRGAPVGRAPVERDHLLIGLFGYGYDGAAVELMVEAVRRVGARGGNVRLALFGVAGRSAAVAEACVAAARSQGIEDLLSISGFMRAQELSNALAACDVLLFPDAYGPTSRKGTLAAALSSGMPVIALEGPSSWPELVQADAVRLARPVPEAVADAIGALLADAPGRAALGMRGRVFAERHMSAGRSAQAVASLLEDLIR
jgi:glycosyltransferase involved in cell wall biosynthesis